MNEPCIDVKGNWTIQTLTLRDENDRCMKCGQKYHCWYCGHPYNNMYATGHGKGLCV